MSAPTAEDVIARVHREHTIECTGIGEVTCRGCRDLHWMTWTAYRQHVAAAVVAAVRAMSPAQQAELVGGLTERGTFSRVADDVPVATRVRVVGPWRAEP